MCFKNYCINLSRTLFHINYMVLAFDSYNTQSKTFFIPFHFLRNCILSLCKLGISITSDHFYETIFVFTYLQIFSKIQSLIWKKIFCKHKLLHNFDYHLITGIPSMSPLTYVNQLYSFLHLLFESKYNGVYHLTYKIN